jgi:hypothetical protein
MGGTGFVRRDDKESRRKFAEIKLRACVKIGEISLELEKAQYNKGHGTVVPSDGKYKEQQLKESGISTSTANRYEELVGESVEIGIQTADEYFANAAANNEPVTMKGYLYAHRWPDKETFRVWYMGKTGRQRFP